MDLRKTVERTIAPLQDSQIIRVYHEPGSGASTLGHNLLWDLREKFLSIVVEKDIPEVENIINQVCDEEVRLLLLFDNIDPNAFLNRLKRRKYTAIKLVRIAPTYNPGDENWILRTELEEVENLSFKMAFKAASDRVKCNDARAHMYPLLTFCQEYHKIDELVSHSVAQLSLVANLLLSAVCLLWVMTNVPVSLLAIRDYLNKYFPKGDARKIEDEISYLLVKKEIKNWNTNKQYGVKPPVARMGCQLLVYPPSKYSETVPIDNLIPGVDSYSRYEQVVAILTKLLELSPKENFDEISRELFHITHKKSSTFLRFLRYIYTEEQVEGFFNDFAEKSPHVCAHFARYLYHWGSKPDMAFKMIKKAIDMQTNSKDHNLFAMQGDLYRLHYLKFKAVEHYNTAIESYEQARYKGNLDLNILAVLNELKLRIANAKNAEPMLLECVNLLDLVGPELPYADDSEKSLKVYYQLCQDVFLMQESLPTPKFDSFTVPLKLRINQSSVKTELRDYSQLHPNDLRTIIKITKQKIQENMCLDCPLLVSDCSNFFYSCLWNSFRDNSHNIDWWFMTRVISTWKDKLPNSSEAQMWFFAVELTCFLRGICRQYVPMLAQKICDCIAKISNSRPSKVKCFIGNFSGTNWLVPFENGMNVKEYLNKHLNLLHIFKGKVVKPYESLCSKFELEKKFSLSVPLEVGGQNYARQNAFPSFAVIGVSNHSPKAYLLSESQYQSNDVPDSDSNSEINKMLNKSAEQKDQITMELLKISDKIIAEQEEELRCILCQVTVKGNLEKHNDGKKHKAKEAKEEAEKKAKEEAEKSKKQKKETSQEAKKRSRKKNQITKGKKTL